MPLREWFALFLSGLAALLPAADAQRPNHRRGWARVGVVELLLRRRRRRVRHSSRRQVPRRARLLTLAGGWGDDPAELVGEVEHALNLARADLAHLVGALRGAGWVVAGAG